MFRFIPLSWRLKAGFYWLLCIYGTIAYLSGGWDRVWESRIPLTLCGCGLLVFAVATWITKPRKAPPPRQSLN